MKGKNVFLILIGVILLNIGGLYYYLNIMSPNGHTKSKTVEKKKEIYTCPMHPQIISDKGGSCPICGMDLVLQSHDEEEHKSKHGDHVSDDKWEDVSSENKEPEGRTSFKLSLEKEQIIGVKVEVAKKRRLFKSISAPGRIAFDPDLYTAQSEFLESIKQWERIKHSPIKDIQDSTKEMIRSAKIRLRVLGLSNGQIERLRKKGSQSESLLVAGKGKDNWVYADVFEMDVPYISKGLSAKVTANFLQGKILPAKVISVDQVINTSSRTAKVRIQLKGDGSNLRPESYVNVTILAPLGEHLSVPIEAIFDTGKDQFLFVSLGKGKYEPRKVTVLFEAGGFKAIGSGLKDGEKIVIGGNFMLDSESRLKSVIKGALSGADEHQNH